MSVYLKDKYREETNKDVYSEDNVYGGSGGSYSDQYVKWLEKQVKNNDLLHSVIGCFKTLEECEKESIKFTKEQMKVVGGMLSNDYKTGYKEGVEHYLQKHNNL